MLVVDEVRIDQEAEVWSAWYEENMKTVVKVDRPRAPQPFIGFLDQSTRQCFT